MNNLVSILTPCYNGAKFIDRYVESLLAQDYNNCQLIFMNDGSTDNSEEKILGHKKILEDKGFIFEYHCHKNMGVAATVDEGIKYVKGDFLVWPDVDDLLTPDFISKKLRFLIDNPQYGLVRTPLKAVYSTDINTEVRAHDWSKPIYKKEDLFEDYVYSRNAWFQPGCYMVRMSAFDDANPDRYIYHCRIGQNWQMLLPVLYKYKCGFLNEKQYIYVLNPGSISDASKDSLEKALDRLDAYEDIITHTIQHMNIPDTAKYTTNVHIHYLREKLGRSLDYNDAKKLRGYYKELKEENAITKKDFIKYILVHIPFGSAFFLYLRKKLI